MSNASNAINEAYEDYPLVHSRKSVNNAYEEYVLSVGDFDERIFLDKDADEEIGTPAKTREEVAGEFSEYMQQKKSLQQHFDETRTLAPSTPLTGRRYLKEKDPTITPVSTATQSVSKLQHLLSGLKTAPSDRLQELLLENGGSPLLETITQRVQEMGEIFCNHYVQPSENHPGSQLDFAKRRLHLGECLYYKTLESILTSEKKRSENGKDHKANLTALVEHEIFHKSLMACCLEIIIFSYNSQRIFPWIVDIFDLKPFYFYKVIEIIVREEEGLSRDVVKHLNHIEESILETLAWKNDSPLWEAIKATDSIPLSAEVSLPSHAEQLKELKGNLRRIVLDRQTGTVVKDPLQSPTGPSAADAFSSPSPGSAKRRLFSAPGGSNAIGTQAAVITMSAKVPDTSAPTTAAKTTPAPKSTPAPTPAANKSTQHLVAFQQVITQDGRQVLIPVQTQVLTPQSPPVKNTTTEDKQPAEEEQNKQAAQQANKKSKGGSLGLFIRKVYHLAHVRLQDLCDRLEIDDQDLHKKIWTLVEHVVVTHTKLLKDRHLDQIIMCAVYVIAKVTDKPQSFQNIMKCYRLQPQAQSHVYRSVLLTSRDRHPSGSSDGSRAGASRNASPATVDKEENSKDKKSMLIRSSSTLPVPHPSSHPPTPTKLECTGVNFEFSEERGDLIQFYNRVFVTAVKQYAVRFSVNHQNGDMPLLSPLPATRCHTTSPRRVSKNYSVYISPHKVPSLRCMSPKTESKMSYCINRSPANNLRAINNMIKLKSENKMEYFGKRQLQIDINEEPENPPKRISLMRRLQEVTTERQEQASKYVVVS